MALMKLALIPPNQMLEDIMKTETQLLLPNELMFNAEYHDRYKNLLTRTSQLTILDNGAAENAQVVLRALFDLAYDWMPTEVAIPDRLGDATGTYDLLQNFFIWNVEALKEIKDINLGFVAQGRTLTEALYLVRRVMNSPYSKHIKTVYLPRLLVQQPGQPKDIRLRLAATINSEFQHLAIHLFGASTLWCSEVFEAAGCSFIRSMDTSLPYTLAAAGIELGDKVTEVIPRPDNYFKRQWSEEEMRIAAHNVEHVVSWTL